MTAGPLPNPDARRRNKPFIPTTKLPARGRTKADQPAPPIPHWWVDKLGSMAVAWWDWAWSTPQSFGWSDGDLPFLARRAWLEELQHQVPKDKASAMVNAVLNMDHKLGLSPKGMAELRWSIAGDEPSASAPRQSKAKAAAVEDRKARILSAVEAEVA